MVRVATAAVVLFLAAAPAGTAAAAGVAHKGVRYEGELGVGFVSTDCPELGRAGLAILSCEEQRPDYAGLVSSHSRLAWAPWIDLELSLDERLRLVAPRSHGALSSLDSVTDLQVRLQLPRLLGLESNLTIGFLFAPHFEPDVRWQRWTSSPHFVLVVVAPNGLLIELSEELPRTRFATDFPKNSYALIDSRGGRGLLRLKRWFAPWLRLGLSGDLGYTLWLGPVDDLLADLVDLGELKRFDSNYGLEGEVAIRPVPALVLSISFRSEWNGSNVPLFRHYAYGPAAGAAYSGGGHTLAVSVRWLYYRFPDAVVAPQYFTNVREDHHLEAHLRWRVDLSDRWSAELSYSYVGNDSSDARVLDAVCARPEFRGCADLGDRGEALAAITSFSRYAQSVLEAQLFFHW
ncbi:MAG TPA: hypothetical protein VG389_14185 [Myxococcota bacterium]|jgi:hypothetical protein|nr:hypothetical protein [Myxococcota bacterium]